jgi:zinc transporter, ZIP family
VIGGILLGLVFILFADKFLSKYEHLHIRNLNSFDTKKILLIVGVMTLHSFAEGVAIGVSFEPALSFGIFIALAMALHNIPEGLAISTVMTSKGFKRRQAGLWSIFTSLPQPLMAIPAFLFVEQFSGFLPIGLGFAAGAMLRMSLSELLPDALEGAPASTVATIATIGIAAMIAFQQLIG